MGHSQSKIKSLPRSTASRFSESELEILNKLFKDLAKRSPGKTMDRSTFFQVFPMPGMHAESLFDLFDLDKNGVIDYQEFMTGLAIFSKGAPDEKIEAIFKIYDIDKTNYVSKDELKTMLLHIPMHTLHLVDKCKEAQNEERTHKVARLVDEAFFNFDTNKDNKLSKEQFTNWAKNTPSIIDFLDSYSLSDELDLAESTMSGFLFKNGKRMKGICFKRFYILRGNSLYYYHMTDLTRPSGVVFLQGCFISDLEPKSPSRRKSPPGSPTSSGKGFFFSSSPPKDSRLPNSPANSPNSPFALGLVNRIAARSPSKSRTESREEFIEEEDMGNQPWFKSILNVSHMFGFKIKSEKLPTRIIYADSEESRNQWVAALRTACNMVVFEDKYEQLNKIGEGSFGTVFKCRLKVTPTNGDSLMYATKVVNKTKLKDAKKIEDLYKELSILKLVEHPNIIRMRDFYESENFIHIVLDFAQGGDLIDQLTGKGSLTEEECKHIMSSLFGAIKYLHQFGICHRDLKPDNILCAGGKSILESKFLICDFGLSKLVSPKGVMTEPVGTLAYVAPEILLSTWYSKAADLWSLGVIMYLISKGHLPFQPPGSKVTQMELSNHIAYTRIDPKEEFSGKFYSNDFFDVLGRLLDKDPITRLTAHAALEHPWMANQMVVGT